MAFRTEDFKRTTRKSKTDAPPSVYPHSIKDKKDTAKLARILSLWDANVGRRRGELDGAALVDFVGDPRLARGLVAVLGQWYKWRTLSPAQAFGNNAAQLLSTAGIAGAMAARAHTYARVNTSHDGFLTEEARAEVYAALAAPFTMDAAQWDDLLSLDTENSQVLTRTGRVPTPEDVRAAYNFHSVDTVLKRATSATLTGLSDVDAADLRAFARSLGATAKVGKEGVSVTVSIPYTLSSAHSAGEDPLSPNNGGTRRVPTPPAAAVPVSPVPPLLGAGGGNGAKSKLGRVLLLLLHAHATRQTAGFIDATLGGRVFRMAVNADTCRAFGCTFTSQTASLHRCTAHADTLLAELLKHRAKGSAAGWGFRRLPEAWADSRGVFVPDLKLTRGDRTVWVTLSDAPTGSWDVPVVPTRIGRSPAKDAARVLSEAADALDGLFAASVDELPLPVPAGVRELCAKAAAQGLVRVADVQRVLHVPDEARLCEWFGRAGDGRVRYVLGVGVVARDLEDALTARTA